MADSACLGSAISADSDHYLHTMASAFNGRRPWICSRLLAQQWTFAKEGAALTSLHIQDVQQLDMHTMLVMCMNTRYVRGNSLQCWPCPS